ncbi:AAA family ATPase [Mycoplasmopsis glycophila]|uniref:Chromosome partition protein Smc n=1 Tax=Mycoplasmopsis glycophila TaxID=171285 RepID=A0A449AWM2_9BACT|nr:AAA family ATPase [Mycoplasmopsis glycophila]VEU71159.1 ABC transporter ATP-binding protein [Mycoplasmopsis glycophila]
MKLIKLEAHGFKSFADPIVLKFDGEVAGIVGPNGSGKSNINDAIRWVLGEQSSKELRGDTMEDVIFSGSKTVPAMNKATVTLTFDNSDGISSVDSDIITITRSLQRGKGINEYFLNGEPCRQKDIKTIAMETGIGKSSLAIISQGTVSEIAQSSDEQRRLIFEEAAGVSKYKVRKVEAIKKLERTESTLKQIETIVRELERRLEPLKKQAEKALLYKEKSAKLEKIEIAFLAHEIQRLEKVYDELHSELAGVEDTQKRYKDQIDKLDISINTKKTELHKFNSELVSLRSKKDSISIRLGDLRVTEAKENEKRDLIARGEIKANEEERLAAILTKTKELEQKIDYFSKVKYDLEIKSETSSNSIKELQSELQENFRLLNESDKKINYARLQLNLLLEKKNKQTNLFKGTRSIVQNKQLFKGYKGLVSDLLSVKREYATAIETILANATQHIVVDKSETAVEGINFLKKNNGGRATFIPLNTIQPKYVRDDYLFVLKNQPGYVDIASNLVETKAEFSKLKEFLLGNIIITKDIESGNKISKILESKYMIVSLDGDIIRAGGVMVGGTKQESDDAFSLDDKIKEFQAILPVLENDKNLASKEIQTLQSKINNEQAFYNEYHKELATINVRLEDFTSEIKEYKILATSFDNSKQSTEINLGPLHQKIQELEAELRLIEFDLQTKTKIEENFKTELNQFEEERKNISKMLINLSESFAKKMKVYQNAEFYLDQYKERLANHYKLTLDYAIENYELELSIESAGEVIKQLRKEIEELGNVNLESIEELAEVEERYESFSTNLQELVDAKTTILEAIEQMDKVIITRLTNIVTDVNKEFSRVFSSMFGGGNAEVKFVDPHNILESGISIYAQPPGKSIKNLKLFSGGEKSLIAISLLFAILRARPLPLCILDEVEAALDENNVLRYGEYLQELKKQTQFLVITHRIGTMTKVDALFGATMQHRGVTSFFSVKLEDAKKMVDEK